MFHSFSHRTSNANCRRFRLFFLAAIAGLVGLATFYALESPAWASHYRIVDVPDVIPAEHHDSLKKAGIETTKALYLKGVARKGRRAIARKSGIDPKLVTAWVRFIDLMQLEGIGPKMVRVLNASGVHSLQDFQREKAAGLLLRMKAANRGFRYARVLPDERLLSRWIERAKKTPLRMR